MATLRVADFNEVQVAFAAIPIDGWADGDVLTFTWESDQFTDVVGVTGDVARGKTNDLRATCEIRLLQTSPANAILSGIWQADQLAPGGAGVGALSVVDLNSAATLLIGANSWIQRAPDAVWSREPGERVWTIRIAELRAFFGGNI